MYATFEDDEAGVATRKLIGVGNLLWGNDYPHHDAIWPNSMSTLDRVFEGVPDAERERMVWSNTVDLYGIDTSKLPAAAA
jgi:predicted TIM-barrel fold metal-dependent hydrolase